MKLMKAAIALALATGLAGASSAFANGGPDERELWETLKKSAETRTDRMATKTGSMNAMEKRSGAMDKGGKGMLSAEEIARILDPNVANP